MEMKWFEFKRLMDNLIIERLQKDVDFGGDFVVYPVPAYNLDPNRGVYICIDPDDDYASITEMTVEKWKGVGGSCHMDFEESDKTGSTPVTIRNAYAYLFQNREFVIDPEEVCNQYDAFNEKYFFD